MSDWIDQFVFYDELSEEARSNLDSKLKRHGEAAAAFEEWKQLRAILRRDLGVKIQDRRLLIHFGMWRYGNASLLTPSELAEVEESLPHFESALRGSDALRKIVEQIGDDQLDFEETWRLHAGDVGTGVEIEARRPSLRSHRARHRRIAIFWRVAAVFAIGAVSALLYLSLGFDTETVVVRSGDNGIRSVVLDDGTVVRLVADAELTYRRPTKDEAFDRRVNLTGQALFRVTPGAKVFVVETPTAMTTVWGTTFGLDSDDSFTEVVLAEGRVSVVSRRDTQHPVVLEPGEMTRVVGAREPTSPVRVNITDALSYTRLFVFRNEMTLTIANKLAEHFGVAVKIHPDLAQETVTGTFERDWSLGYILQTVARTLDGEVRGSDIEGYELVPLELRGP